MASSSALKMSFENEAGVSKPLGYWDPLKLAKDEATFSQYRTAEVKHGRVAQLAVIGYVVPEVFKFSFELAPGLPCTAVPNGIAALSTVPALGWLQIAFLIGAVDYRGFLVLGDTEVADKSPEELKELKTKELNHGRLAMIATLELLRHDSQKLIGGMYADDNLITGLPFLYQ
jgi:hypothetical protein